MVERLRRCAEPEDLELVESLVSGVCSIAELATAAGISRQSIVNRRNSALRRLRRIVGADLEERLAAS